MAYSKWSEKPKKRKAPKRSIPTTPKAGRKKGVPNLTKTDDGYINRHGVKFTAEEKKELEKAVNRSNYRRKKQMDEYFAKHPDKHQLYSMGRDPDLSIPQQKTTLQNFSNRREFQQFMRKQERIQNGKYVDDLTKLYKRNHLTAIENNLGSGAKDIYWKIRNMPLDEYRRLIEENSDFLEIHYVYDPADVDRKANKIRSVLNMEHKELPMEV